MASAAIKSGASLALRPGVAWPLWSLVTDPAARQALEAGLAATRWLEKWAGLERDADRVWQEVLRGFARTGRAQDARSIATATGFEPPVVAEILRGLRGRDMLVLDDGGLSVTAAYPFCAWQSGHGVSLTGGEPVPSLCAIDALGAGAMLGEDAVIASACHSCGAPIRIALRERGRALGGARPSTATLWYGVRYAENCSATSSCRLKVFFCSEAHLSAWREDGDGAGAGFRLSLSSALEIALAVFLPLLMPEAPGS